MRLTVTASSGSRDKADLLLIGEPAVRGVPSKPLLAPLFSDDARRQSIDSLIPCNCDEPHPTEVCDLVLTVTRLLSSIATTMHFELRRRSPSLVLTDALNNDRDSYLSRLDELRRFVIEYHMNLANECVPGERGAEASRRKFMKQLEGVLSDLFSLSSHPSPTLKWISDLTFREECFAEDIGNIGITRRYAELCFEDVQPSNTDHATSLVSLFRRSLTLIPAPLCSVALALCPTLVSLGQNLLAKELLGFISKTAREGRGDKGLTENFVRCIRDSLPKDVASCVDRRLPYYPRQRNPDNPTEPKIEQTCREDRRTARIRDRLVQSPPKEIESLSEQPAKSEIIFEEIPVVKEILLNTPTLHEPLSLKSIPQRPYFLKQAVNVPIKQPPIYAVEGARRAAQRVAARPSVILRRAKFPEPDIPQTPPIPDLSAFDAWERKVREDLERLGED